MRESRMQNFECRIQNAEFTSKIMIVEVKPLDYIEYP